MSRFKFRWTLLPLYVTITVLALLIAAIILAGLPTWLALLIIAAILAAAGWNTDRLYGDPPPSDDEPLPPLPPLPPGKAALATGITAIGAAAASPFAAKEPTG